MPRWRWLVLVFSLPLVGATVQAASDKPQQVRDLHYGEVLFHFYQDDYFTAITHLLAAQQQDQLRHHREEAELLLGGLQLSYGMLDAAESRFQRLLEPDKDPALHDRVHYFLSRIHYQRGNYDKAGENLRAIGAEQAPARRGELTLLDANIKMHLGQDRAAAEVLGTASGNDDQEEYLAINRGIALLRAGDIAAGRRVLDKLGKDRKGTEEARALRDRANLGLGYELLRTGEPEAARAYLDRVRLQGPFVQAALLGAGWTDAERGDYQAALTPWLELLQASGHQPAAHEVRLAVPYALAQMGKHDRAVHFYNQALEYYAREQHLIDQAIDTTANGTLVAALEQTNTGRSGGWLQANPKLDDIPAGQYLVEVLAGNAFQESLKDYRDLGYLDRMLEQWRDDIGLYYDMVEARRIAYQERAPGIRERLAQQQAHELQSRWKTYRARVEAAANDNAPLALATGREKSQWARLEAIDARLARLPDDPRFTELQEKADWLRGILYWQLNADYKTRLWETRKQLAALEPQVRDTLDTHRGVEAALENIKSSFTGYDARITALRNRIQRLQPRVAAARQETGEQLQRLALAALEQRRARLDSYRSQARYALARTHDQLARRQGEQP